jgi:phosphoglycerol transferase MdoB-like AlkP superfamily enzyme
MRDVFAFIADLLRRQFRFYGAIIAIGVVGIVYAKGWSWTSAIVLVIAAVIMPLGYALAWFWVQAFRGMSRREDAR